VMALALTSGSWVIFGIARVAQESERFSIPADLVLQLLPQGYMAAMWEPVGWFASAVVCCLLGGLVLLSTFPIFLRRDL